MNNIFISYRRADSADVVGRIYDYLEGFVGKDNIFKDVHSVQAGIDYLQFTANTLTNCDVQLAIIGQHWLDGRRIDNSDDLVRVEIETAMGRDIPVIPVLVGGADMPSEDELPDSLKPLAYRNAMKVRPDPDFPTDMARLVQALEGIISVKPVPKQNNRKWLLVAGALLVLSGPLGYFMWTGGSSSEVPDGADTEMSRSTAPTRSAQDTGAVDQAMGFVDQYNGTGQILDARNQVSDATNNAMELITTVLQNPDLSEQELATAYSDTILQVVEQENLHGPLERLFKFYEQVLVCREMKICDEKVLSGFLDDDAGGISRTYYPWVCKVRSDWNNPAAFESVLNFYLEGDSAQVCES